MRSVGIRIGLYFSLIDWHHPDYPAFTAWQFYGPSTRKGDRLYLHLLMKPYETITVRGVPIKRVKSVRILADGTELSHTTRCALLDLFSNPDPLGEVTVQVPEMVIDPYATVIAIDFNPKEDA